MIVESRREADQSAVGTINRPYPVHRAVCQPV